MASKNKYDWQSTWWDSLERPAQDKSKETVSNFLSGVGNFINNTWGNTFNKSQQQQAASRQPSANAYTIADQASGNHKWSTPTAPSGIVGSPSVGLNGDSRGGFLEEMAKNQEVTGGNGGEIVTGYYGGGGYNPYPSYVSPYESQLQAALDKLINREEFSYDYLSDPVYQQYAKQYGIQGDMARQDTLGDVASMTGGMPSSWAVSAAQQAQNSWNSGLNDIIPSLQEAAYQKYLGNYEADANLASLLSSLDGMAYERYNQDRNYDLAIQEANNRVRKAVSGVSGGSGNVNLNIPSGLTYDETLDWAISKLSGDELTPEERAELAERMAQINELRGYYSGGGLEL